MFNKLTASVVGIAMAVTPTMAFATSTASFNLRLTVPVLCSVTHDSSAAIGGSTGVFSLGAVREYCNASRGYELIMTYAPGSLQGAVIQAGQDTVVLDGSGRAVLSREFGPKKQMRPLSIVPGINGFDTDRLAIDIVPLQG